MNTKQLRQKILDLAIRGKLVPQDPNDEPASVLLERVRAEKERLIKEGKIRRDKNESKIISSDKSHYEELPKGWELVQLSALTSLIGDGIHGTPTYNDCGDYYFINGNNINTANHKICFYNSTKKVDHNEYIKYSKPLNQQTVLLSINGTVGNVAFYNKEKIILGKSAAFINLFPEICKEYIAYFLQSEVARNYYLDRVTGITIKNLSLADIRTCEIPLPPLAEQIRIVVTIGAAFAIIDEIEANKSDLFSAVTTAKQKILSLAISGKLVPQDPNDEPASVLLERIQAERSMLASKRKAKKPAPKPILETADTFHYGQLPKGWAKIKFDEVLEYQQPTEYIVESVNYDDSYKIPVLTAGKSFIIGYTNENFGICKKLPVIIFDDFTTDSRFVDFPFKVKSSAMKILRANTAAEIKYLYYFMQTIECNNSTHKRYWISDYSQKIILLPPLNEQKRIVAAIETQFEILDTITKMLN